jgi:hypothetical protein
MMQPMEGFPMSLPSLLLLASLLAAPLAATDTAQPASPSAQPQVADVFAVPAADGQHPSAVPTPQPKADLAGQSDGICYKIRAFIFKRDDDHAPELAGTTTCGPRQPRTKDVVWPKARLVPAE